MKKNKIESRIIKEVENSTYGAFGLNDIKVRCSYSAKTKTISFLLQGGYISRIINGVYYLTDGPVPSIEEICFAIGRKNGWRVCPLPTEENTWIVKSTGPSRVYTFNGTEIRFVKESKRGLPSPYYAINLACQQIRAAVDAGKDPNKLPADLFRNARKSLSKEEYALGLLTLDDTYDWMKAALIELFSKEPKKFKSDSVVYKGLPRPSKDDVKVSKTAKRKLASKKAAEKKAKDAAKKKADKKAAKKALKEAEAQKPKARKRGRPSKKSLEVVEAKPVKTTRSTRGRKPRVSKVVEVAPVEEVKPAAVTAKAEKAAAPVAPKRRGRKPKALTEAPKVVEPEAAPAPEAKAEEAVVEAEKPAAGKPASTPRKSPRGRKPRAAKAAVEEPAQE